MKRSELSEGMKVHVQGHNLSPATVVSTKPWARGRRGAYEATRGNGVLVQWPGEFKAREVAQLGQIEPWESWKVEHDERTRARDEMRFRQAARKERNYAREASAEIAAEAFGIDRLVRRAYDENGEGTVKVDARLFMAMLAEMPEGFTYEPPEEG